MDINETILVGDEAGGDTREDCLNKALAKSAFVQIPSPFLAVEHDKDSSRVEKDTHTLIPTHWWDGSPIVDAETSTDVVSSKSSSSSSPPPPLHTKFEWPTGTCPYYRTAYKQRSKTFVAHHGRIYRQIFDQMEQTLQPKYQGHAILSHVIPSFFATLIELTSQSQRNDDPAPFTLVLRTMGTDWEEIAAAVTEFARGEHPDYPEYRNPNLEVRSADLVRGRWVQSVQNDNTENHIHDDNDDNDNHHEDYRTSFVYQLTSPVDGTVVASGDEQVLEFLHSRTVCGIQDDYHHWSKHSCEPWAGKPVWIPADRHYHHILFDDNM
jgi:hypothetical protein